MQDQDIVLYTKIPDASRFSNFKTAERLTPPARRAPPPHLVARYFSHAGLAREYFCAFCERHARRNIYSRSVSASMRAEQRSELVCDGAHDRAP